MNNTQTRNIKIVSFFVLTLCFCSLMVFLNQQNQISIIQIKALNRAQIYVNRMVESGFMVKSSKPRISRGLASITYEQEFLAGFVGLDPWGHPFNFLVKKDPINKDTGIIIVWSLGANNKLETSKDMVFKDHESFKGDDFGKAYLFKF